VRQRGGAFEVELRGLAEALNRPIGRAFTRGCDADLGDARCGVDLDVLAFSATATLAAPPSGSVLRVSGLSGFAEGWFTHGTLVWETGANAGVRAVVKQDLRMGGERRLELWEAPALPAAAGERVRVRAGCDKRAATCRQKFANFLNFRGFPHIPGEDWVTAYPRAGDVHEGGTRSWESHDLGG